MFQERTYRRLTHGSRLKPFKVVVKETDLSVYAAHPLEKEARELVLECRGHIESCIHAHPEFATTLAPWPTKGPMPAIVRDMTEAGEKAGVGPMAAVAGAVAEYVGRGLLPRTDEVMVENGGDVFVKTRETLTVGIFAGRSPLSLRIGLRFENPGGEPFAVCTSSGTVGHSLSLGKADAVCVVSPSCALADAVATAAGNHVRSENDIRQAVDFGKNIKGISGILVIVGDKIGAWGEVEIVPLQEP